MPRAFYLGIDNTQPNVVRVLCLASEDLLGTWPYCWTCIKSTDALQAFWTANMGMLLPDAAATTVLEHDPFGVTAWFRNKGVSVAHYDRHVLHQDFDWDDDSEYLDISHAYRCAHALALRAVFEAEAAVVVEQMHREIRVLRNRIVALEQAAQRLDVLIPCPF